VNPSISSASKVFGYFFNIGATRFERATPTTPKKLNESVTFIQQALQN